MRNTAQSDRDVVILKNNGERPAAQESSAKQYDEILLSFTQCMSLIYKCLPVFNNLFDK